MKPFRTYQLFRMVLAPVLPILFTTALLTGFTGCTPEIRIDNPYEKVNWAEHSRFKADVHAHSSRSDGHFSPHIVVDRYHDLGYDILIFADHNMVTYPWQEFSTFKASDLMKRRLEEGKLRDLTPEEVIVYEDRDPDSLGMITVQANEISQHHYLGSYFNDHPGGTLETPEETLEVLADKDGLAVIFSQGLYDGSDPDSPFHPVEWYAELFERYDHLIGMEVYQDGLQHQPGNLFRWDSVLIRLMPDRPVWGFSNDDFHGGIIGRNWNIFLLPELSVEELRHGMENGLSYFIYAPEGHDGPPPPVIESISVNSEKGTIHIEATGCDFILWKSDNKVVYRGNYFNINDFPEVTGYIRAVLYESANGPLAATQPFGIRGR